MGGRLRRRYIDCETRPIYINNCDSNYRTIKSKEACQTAPKKDQFVSCIKPDFSVISDEQKKHYSSIRKIEVKAGEKVSIDFEGTFRGNKKVTGEGFTLQENFGEHYQKELNLSDVAKIHRVRENGKDTYYIGVYHGFNGKLKLTTSNGCGEISTNDKQPVEKNENKEINEPEKPQDSNANPKPNLLQKIKDEQKGIQEAQMRLRGLINDQSTEVYLMLEELIKDCPENCSKDLKKIFAELKAGGMSNPLSLDKSSVKLKLLALQNPVIAEKTNELVNFLREFSSLLKSDSGYKEKTITKFGIDETGRDYNYELKASILDKVYTQITKGSITRDSESQKGLNELIKKANVSRSWNDFDKALEFIVSKDLVPKLYFLD